MKTEVIFDIPFPGFLTIQNPAICFSVEPGESSTSIYITVLGLCLCMSYNSTMTVVVLGRMEEAPVAGLTVVSY